MATSKTFTDPAALAEAVVRRVGKRVVLGLPLGLGKATHLTNALYALAEADRSIELNIFTALTLEAPNPQTDLEKRFLGPIYDAAFGGYPKLAYAQAQRAGTLPPNVEVNEFFFQAGTRTNSPQAQQHYISANYTHAVRVLAARGVNVIGQLVAARGKGASRRFSLSCNSDTTLDLLPYRDRGHPFLLVGQVNDELPFMGGDADLPAETFDFILDGCDFPLFAPPKEAVGDSHYATGFHVASLVPDGGTLQLGIGATADAICQALIVRQKAPEVFKATVESLCPGGLGSIKRHFGPFEEGLHACTEMFVDGFLELYEAGLLKREVNGHVLYGGFFLGQRSFYRRLREMDDQERSKFAMKAISFTNSLYGEQERKVAERPGARFANTCMMATLLGAAVSDGFDDGRVLSGVGGQFNFVDPGLRPVRRRGGRPFDPHRQRRAGGGGRPQVQPPLVLRPRHHSPALEGCVRLRIRGGRPAGPYRCGDHRRHAGHRRQPVPGRPPGEGPRRREDPQGLPHPRGRRRQYARGARRPLGPGQGTPG